MRETMKKFIQLGAVTLALTTSQMTLADWVKDAAQAAEVKRFSYVSIFINILNWAIWKSTHLSSCKRS